MFYEKRNKVVKALYVNHVIFGFKEGELKVLLCNHDADNNKNTWSLPGGFVRSNEFINDASQRVLYTYTGMKKLYLEQLQIFDNVNNEFSEEAVNIVMMVLVKPKIKKIRLGLVAKEAQWFNINELPQLIGYHNQLIHKALVRLRVKVQYEYVAFELLNDRFTFRELQKVYEAIYGVKLDKPNFRKKMLQAKLLVDSEHKEVGTPFRTASLFKLAIDVKKLKTNNYFFEPKKILPYSNSILNTYSNRFI